MLAICFIPLILVLLWAARAMWRRGLLFWLPSYLRQTRRRSSPPAGRPIHLLLCIADHYEPRNGGTSRQQARERVNAWVTQYPRLFGHLRDSDGMPPRHTFFYPIEQYAPHDLDALAALCHARFGEVEIHLHHRNDNAESLRERLHRYKQLFWSRHHLLSRRRSDGRLFYAFVHGDWALDNSGLGGRCCGVNNELEVLVDTGCYADFTLPSAPDHSQTRTINTIYYASGRPGRSKSHDRGTPVGSAPQPPDSLMLIQGPLLLNWRNRKWGLIPRIENGCIQSNQPPTMQRLNLWLRASVQVPARPDWYFVKLHTHGAPEHNQRVLLGPPMLRFHQDLSARAAADPNFHYHYVTAREMYNLARAAEAGWTGSVADARDFELAPPGVFISESKELTPALLP